MRLGPKRKLSRMEVEEMIRQEERAYKPKAAEQRLRIDLRDEQKKRPEKKTDQCAA